MPTFVDQLAPLLIQPVIGADIFGVFVITAAVSNIAICIFVIVVCEGLSFGTFESVFFNFQNHVSVYFFAGLADVFIPENAINFNLFTEGGFGNRIIIFVVFFAEAGVLADDNFFAGVDIFYDTDNIDPLLIPSGVVSGVYTFQSIFFQIPVPPFPSYALILLTTVYHKHD